MIEIVKLEKYNCTPCSFVELALNVVKGETDVEHEVSKVNVEDNPEIAAQYNIMSVPVLVFKKEGQEVARLTGKSTPPQILEILEGLK